VAILYEAAVLTALRDVSTVWSPQTNRHKLATQQVPIATVARALELSILHY
jgi:hypothetical protein